LTELAFDPPAMKYYDLYGTRDMTIDELQEAVGSVLETSFQARYSSFIGPYYTAELGNEVFDIEPNFMDDRDEDEVLEPEFADYPVLLRVSRTQRGDEIREALAEIPGLELLRRDTRPD
jgi:hypothetical protein